MMEMFNILKGKIIAGDIDEKTITIKIENGVSGIEIGENVLVELLGKTKGIGYFKKKTIGKIYE